MLEHLSTCTCMIKFKVMWFRCEEWCRKRKSVLYCIFITQNALHICLRIASHKHTSFFTSVCADVGWCHICGTCTSKCMWSAFKHVRVWCNNCNVSTIVRECWCAVTQATTAINYVVVNTEALFPCIRLM